jgi:hypothetical protein
VKVYSCCAIVFILLLLSATIVIVQKASAYDPGTARLPTWSSPAIEQCSKPLWDRIKDGCEDRK